MLMTCTAAVAGSSTSSRPQSPPKLDEAGEAADVFVHVGGDFEVMVYQARADAACGGDTLGGQVVIDSGGHC
jgi:hypothetical protein